MPDQPFGVDLEPLVQFASGGIVSKSFLETARLKLVLFCMEAGQQLSEHTASMPAIIHVLSGRGTLTLGDQAQEVSPGRLVYMPAGTVHALQAQENLVFLLTLVR